MVADLTGNGGFLRIFAINPHTQQFGAAFQLFPTVWFDGATGFTDNMRYMIRHRLQNLLDGNWLNMSMNHNPVSAALSPGLNAVNVDNPLVWQVQLRRNNDYVNEWYGLPRMGKFGFIRQTGPGGKGPVIWLNDLNSSGNFATFLAAGVEVMLAPGISGSLNVYRMLGPCPIEVELPDTGTTFWWYQGWQFFGTATIPANAGY
jgi:hypothetical protein